MFESQSSIITESFSWNFNKVFLLCTALRLFSWWDLDHICYVRPAIFLYSLFLEFTLRMHLYLQWLLFRNWVLWISRIWLKKFFLKNRSFFKKRIIFWLPSTMCFLKQNFTFGGTYFLMDRIILQVAQRLTHPMISQGDFLEKEGDFFGGLPFS